MKKLTLLLTALLLCCALLFTGCGGDSDEPAQQPADSGVADDGTGGDDEYYIQDLDISNDTGVAIMELYISPSEMENWGDDLLGDNSFDNGATVHFSTDLVGTAGATWDIMVVDEDGDQIEFTGIDFSSNTALSLNWGSDGQTPTVTYGGVMGGDSDDRGSDDDGEDEDEGDGNEYYIQDLDISNDTGVAIMELYISPSEMENWGDDLLGDNSFDNGATVHFNTSLVGTAGVTWDILVIDEDGDQIVFTGVDFSSNTALSLNWGSDGQTPMVSYR